MSKAICVTSGGMDSISMALKMIEDGHEVILFHGDLKQKSQSMERRAVEEIGIELKVETYFVDLSWLGELGGSSLTDINIPVPKGMQSLEESTYIKNYKGPGLWTPARNVVLLACASALAERRKAEFITWGANQSETAYPDNTIEFADRFSYMLEFGCLEPAKVMAPLYDYDKVTIIQWGYLHNYEWVYNMTWSCDEGFHKPCGECGCCCNRRFAFLIAGVLNQSVWDLADGQVYMKPDYFHNIYLPELKEKCAADMWMYKYLDLIK